jgi:2'-5' RNA ligase
LWLGLTEGSDVVARLADAVADRTAALGIERSARSFHPHLTLARFRARTDVRELIAAIGTEPVGPEWEVDAVTVFESELHPEGARYFERATILLPH